MKDKQIHLTETGADAPAKIEKGMVAKFARYAVPAVTGMIVSSLYTVVDGIFVGRGVGSQALAAVNIVFPFIMLQIAVTMLLAVGGANLFSISRGKGANADASGYFNQSIFMAAVLSVVLNAAAIVFSAPLCRLLGANETLLPHCQSYLFWVAAFGVVYIPGLALSVFVRNDGAPGLEMLGTLLGAVTNIVLDWLFIMVFGWGLPGAAIATGIGQMVSVAVFCTHFLSKKCTLRLQRSRLSFRQTLSLLYNGFPSFLMEFSQSALTLSFNTVLVAQMGENGVAAYSIVMYIASIFNMVLIGITQGAQPLISYHFGKQEEGSIRAVYRLGVLSSVLLTVLFYIGILLAGKPLAGLFAPGNPTLIDSAYHMMRLYFTGFFPISVLLMNVLRFQATRRELPSILVSFLRCIGFIQIFLFILPPLLGTNGIFLAFFAGESCHLLISEVLELRSKHSAITAKKAAAKST